MTKDLTSLLIKPTGEVCNLSCGYCFCEDQKNLVKPDNSLMDISILKRLMKQVLKGPEENLTLVWQGGEPLLMGIDFFKEALKLQQTNGDMKILNCIQTNGLLINRDWCKFLKDHNFLVGISLDGEQYIHDKYRVDNKGIGSFKRVLNKIQLLKAYDIPVNLLGVVNSYSVKYPKEIYRFFKSLDLNYFQFIPCINSKKRQKTEAYDLKPKDYGYFLIQLLDFWFEDFSEGLPTTFVRFFDSVFYKYVGFWSPDCTLNRSCGDYLVVMGNGDIFPCDFYTSKEARLGNIEVDDLRTVLNGSKQREFGDSKLNIHEDCKVCEWLDLCNNGCLRGRNEGGKFSLCEGHKIFFQYADSRFKSLADNWRKSNP